VSDEDRNQIAAVLQEVLSGDAVVGRDLLTGANLVDVLHQAALALDRLADAGFDIARAIEHHAERRP
jgi:hypothetical protein